MAIAIDPPSGGLLTVKLTGQWTAAQWREAQAALGDAVRQASEVRLLLVVVEQFLGWTGEGWDELVAPAGLDRQIERMAIVGERKWEDLALMFTGKGLRQIEIESWCESARLEAQVALVRLFERFPDLKLADPEAAPAWRTLPFFRGLETLPVRP